MTDPANLMYLALASEHGISLDVGGPAGLRPWITALREVRHKLQDATLLCLDFKRDPLPPHDHLWIIRNPAKAPQ